MRLAERETQRREERHEEQIRVALVDFSRGSRGRGHDLWTAPLATDMFGRRPGSATPRPCSPVALMDRGRSPWPCPSYYPVALLTASGSLSARSQLATRSRTGQALTRAAARTHA